MLRAQRFRLDVEQDGSTIWLRAAGEFDLAGVGRVEAAFDGLPAQTGHVVFDLRAVTFLDMAGLRTVLRANERARTEPFELVVVRPAGLANRVFTLTRAGAELRMLDHPPTSS